MNARAALRIALWCSLPVVGALAAQRPDPLSEPFQGVTTSGTVVEGLYSIQATGVSTAAVRTAALGFLDALTSEQRSASTFAIDDEEWRRWNNVHRAARVGVAFKDMNEAQKARAYDLLGAALSAKGLEKARDIMRLNETIAELTKRFDEYGEGLYHLVVFGQPSASEPWGWQLEGHHLILNYFVLREQVVMTPAFMGSEPVHAESGKYAGTTVLQDEQNKGLALMRALDGAQQQQARILPQKERNNALAQAYRDNLVLEYAGIPARELNVSQKKLLLDVIAEYVGNMPSGHAKVRMAEVERHLDETRFAWIGDTAADAAFYYRIHSPVILIEFDHQTPVALPGPRVPGRNHIHTVVRTPNGNDYGKDLLRQHYEAHKKDPAHGHQPL